MEKFVFRSYSSGYLFIFSLVITLGFGSDGDWHGAAFGGVCLLLLGFLLFRPRLIIEETELVVVNLTRTHRLDGHSENLCFRIPSPGTGLGLRWVGVQVNNGSDDWLRVRAGRLLVQWPASLLYYREVATLERRLRLAYPLAQFEQTPIENTWLDRVVAPWKGNQPDQ